MNIREFLKLEATAGFVLMTAAVLALIIANSSWNPHYQDILNESFGFQYRNLGLNKPLILWINEGLMVIFFFLIGLEIKRECLIGHLSKASQRLLPILATLGGVLIPAIIFLFINRQNPDNLKGWAIPITTDIAFALGALMLFGKKIPSALKIFLMTVAVLDDLAAVLIIAVFYTKSILFIPLIIAIVIFGILIILNRAGIMRISVYLVLSILSWFFVLKSGVHPTVAGVLCAFTIPLRNEYKNEYKNKQRNVDKNVDLYTKNPLESTIDALHPWVAYIVLPIFAFANAGISFAGLSLTQFQNPLALGIILGLFIGKQLGIFLGTWFTVKLKFVKLPTGINWTHIYGMSVLCGIGFTMSLFIGSLAFEDIESILLIKLGILTGTLLSFIFGCLIFMMMPLHKAQISSSHIRMKM